MPNSYDIPFNRPTAIGREHEHLARALENQHISGDGQFTFQCQELLQSASGAKKALLTTSCTHALEMSAILMDLKPGDEVILPSFTFVSTANAFVLRGAVPKFADIRPDTLNLDESQIESLITSRTRAIIVVHYAGVSCEMDAINDIARRHDLTVVEDNAHGLFGSYKGVPLGSLGQLATLSFHETKNVYCGEGGALLINQPELISRAEIVREKGTNRSQFLRGNVQKYTWVDAGSSYLPSDLLAAFLYGQLEQKDFIQNNRRRVWDNYYKELEPWAEANSVGLPSVPAHCDQAYHMFYLILPDSEIRNQFIKHLESLRIQSVFHYLPLNTSPHGKRLGGKTGDCPTAEKLSAQIVRLPFYTTLSDQEQQQVIDAAVHFQCDAS